MIARLIALLLVVSCTKRNPEACCETADECARLGTTELVICEVGVCVGHLCVNEGPCDGDEDCTSPSTCIDATCTLPPPPIDAAETRTSEPRAQCRQILANHCAKVSRCKPNDPGAAEQCAMDTDAVCGINTTTLSESDCQACRSAFDNEPSCTENSVTEDNCLACYGLTSNGSARCPM